MAGETQQEWVEYRQRKRTERLFEAGQVWSALAAGGVDAETVLVIDFVHFGPSQAEVERLGRHLAENCTVTTEAGPGDYWLLKGTTRPYGLTLSAADHLAWVEFMCDVAADYGCVFSTWSMSAPSLDLTVSSEAFEGGS